MRADIVTARAAAAHAAWYGRQTVSTADIRAAARLALPHRRRRNPFDAPGLDEDLLDQLLAEDEPEPPDPTELPPEAGEAPDPSPSTSSGDSEPSSADRPAEPVEAPDPEPSDQLSERASSSAGAVYRTRLFTAAGVGVGEAGRRSRALTSMGRTVGAMPADREPGLLHLGATIRAAAPAAGRRGRTLAEPLRLAPADLRLAVTEGRESNLVLLVVDASGSMAARRRMEAVKAAALSLLLDAYQRRDKVGLITFRGADATLALPPTSSIDVAARRLRELPVRRAYAVGRGPALRGRDPPPGTHPGPAPAPAAGRGHRRPRHARSGRGAPIPAGCRSAAADRRGLGGDRLRDRPVQPRSGRGAERASRCPARAGRRGGGRPGADPVHQNAPVGPRRAA